MPNDYGNILFIFVHFGISIGDQLLDILILFCPFCTDRRMYQLITLKSEPEFAHIVFELLTGYMLTYDYKFIPPMR